jgi:hypothetical protein
MRSTSRGTRNTRRIQGTLRAEGWLISPAGGDLARWTLLAFHPERGVRLIQVRTDQGPGRAELGELLAMGCHPSWTKEVWLGEDRERQFRVLRLPHLAPLTFTGVEYCDACGVRFLGKVPLSGLCPPCETPAIEESVVRVRPTGHPTGKPRPRATPTDPLTLEITPRRTRVAPAKADTDTRLHDRREVGA